MSYSNLPENLSSTQQPTTDKKRSAYIEAGSPTHCFAPNCRKPFVEKCMHGSDSRYYCTTECADDARKVDLARLERLGLRRA